MSRFLTLATALLATSLMAQEMNDDSLAQASPKSNTNKNDPCACWEHGMGLPNKRCLPAAYNASAAIEVKCGWDVNVFGSFIYWHVGQDNMSMAYIPVVSISTRGAVAYTDNKYKPGFKVGVGFDTDFDDWAGWAEYTWLHESTTTSLTPPALLSGASGYWSSNDWFAVGNPGSANAPVIGKWKMHLDMLDVNMGRPFYQGTKLTLSPYGGLRGLWIRQYYKLTMTNVVGNAYSANLSQSWAIGPNGGIKTNYLMGYGFRFEGTAGASMLYTRYTKLGSKQQNSGTNVITTGSYNDYNTVRPTMDMGIGIGWGSYSFCNKYYFDFSARYDFMYLWGQNMMRSWLSDLTAETANIGSLNLHGLTVSVRMDF